MSTTPNSPQSLGRRLASFTLRLGLFLLIFMAALFLPAGRLDWWQGWLLVGGFILLVTIFSLWMRRRDPDLVRERTHMAENVKWWDKAIMGAYTLLLLALMIVAGLDAGRYQWSAPPAWTQALGWLGFLACFALVWWAQATNTYAARYVRIQDDRGHQVVSAGPYHYIRHPMYAAIILLMVCIPLGLGSLWALLPGGLIAALFVLRTALEDRTLQEELPGYAEYAAKVRFRLLPGIW
ncbi:MAG: isoprenylcysteine carboxylmethyltransferase family protein [Chloroflexota bacterium]